MEETKPFKISKKAVKEAFERVKAKRKCKKFDERTMAQTLAFPPWLRPRSFSKCYLPLAMWPGGGLYRQALCRKTA